MNAGCAQVRRVVSALVEGGNSSVFGLVDWDQRHEPEARIHVLGPGERYSIENCLLDPLLLGALAIRSKKSSSIDLLRDGENYSDLRAFDVVRLQQLAEKVQLKVLNLASAEDLGQLREVRYSGGFPLKISQRYLFKRGHELEDAATEAYPHLNQFHNPGDLLRNCIDPICAELPDFVPMVLRNALKALLDAD